MKKKFLFALLSLLFLLNACASQIINEHIQKGVLVKEAGSGNFIERSRTGAIELIPPLTVRVYEQVERTEETKQYYQKMRVRKMAKPRDYPYSDTYLKILLSTAVLPLFTYDYWVLGSYRGIKCGEEPDKCIFHENASPLSFDYFIEEGTRTSSVRRPHDPSAAVSVFINGYYKGELPISPNGTASLDLTQYRELAETDKDVKLTFKYRDSYAYSLLGKDEVKNLFLRGVSTSN